MEYTLNIKGFFDKDNSVEEVATEKYQDLGEAIKESRMAFDFCCENYDRLRCTITDQDGKVRYCEHN